MTILGSWIDDDSLQQVLHDLCPKAGESDTNAQGHGSPHVAETLQDEEEETDQTDAPTLLHQEGRKPAKATAVLAQLQELKKRAERSGLIAGSRSKSETTDTQSGFDVPSGSQDEQLAALQSWIADQSSAARVEITDSLGNPLVEPLDFESGVPEGLGAAAAVISDANRRVRTIVDFPLGFVMHAHLPSELTLTNITLDTGKLYYSIVILASAPVADSKAREFLNAFFRVVPSSPFRPA